MNPERIGGYEILGELGRGAMGVVYHARDAAIGRPVAIKVIRIDAGVSAAESALLRQRLIREASVAGKISHPGIVTVYQLGEEGDNVFIVMEFVDGSSLESLLTHNPALDRGWALDILAQIAVALDYAHKAGVVHRDIKPANILVRSDGRVKIADFGIAKITASATVGMTGTGVSVGSPAYMSPEQIQAAELDGRSDQFALATIAFQMFARRMPFKGATAHTLMFQIVTADPFEPQPGDLPLTPEVRAVLGRALGKKPSDRFPDCISFIQELGVADARPAQVTAASTHILPLPKKADRSWMVLPILGGILTLGLMGAGIYYYLRWHCCSPAPEPAPVAIAAAAPSPTPAPEPVPTPTPSLVTAPRAKNRPAPVLTIHAAVAAGKIDVVKSLLANGANVNERDADGSTPLMIASENSLPLVQLLIDARASLEARDSRGRTSLHRAAAAGKTNVAGLLLDSGALVNPKANDGATPLLYAVQSGRLPMVELLLAHRAQVDLADSSGTTPLMLASVHESLPIVEALLTAGAKVDILDAQRRTALYRASAEARPEAVRLLLEHQAKPNVRAGDGSTPLIQAITFGRPAVAQALVNHGADVNLADASGATPLIVAVQKPYAKDPGVFIKLLLEHGAKRGLKDSKGRTALECATENQNAAALALLK